MYIASVKNLVMSIVCFFLIVSNELLMAQSRNFPFDQFEIPLSNTNGVPFYSTDVGDHIGGFEVDSAENYYFLGGPSLNRAILVKIDKNGKIIYRKTYDGFHANQIYLNNDDIYFFDNFKRKNTMYVLNSNNGSVLRQYPFPLTNVVNDGFWFTDSTITLWVFNIGRTLTMKTPMAYAKFSIDGKYLGQLRNTYGLPSELYGDTITTSLYLGSLKDTLIFLNIGLTDTGKIDLDYRFWMEDTSGKVLATAKIVGDDMGMLFLDTDMEDWKFRNRMIYGLMEDGKNALITRIPIEKLFGL